MIQPGRSWQKEQISDIQLCGVVCLVLSEYSNIHQTWNSLQGFVLDKVMHRLHYSLTKLNRVFPSVSSEHEKSYPSKECYQIFSASALHYTSFGLLPLSGSQPISEKFLPSVSVQQGPLSNHMTHRRLYT